MSGRMDELKRGWRTVLAAAAGASVGTTGLAFYTFGLFVKPLSQAFGWPRGQISLGLTWLSLTIVVAAPAVGALMDRFGVRRVAAPSLVGVAVAYALLSRVGGPIWTFYLACFGVALLGCGTSPVTWTRAVSVKFERGRGMALGLTLLGSALSSTVGVPLLQQVIAHHGWPAAYLAMAVFTLVVPLPLTLAFLGAPPRGSRGTPAIEAAGSSLAHATRTIPFWLIGFGALILITAQSGLVVHMVALLTDRGLSGATAAGLAGMLGIVIFLSRLIIGVMLDRFNPAMVAGLAMLAPVVSAVILATCGANLGLLTVAVALQGLSSGAEIDFVSFFAARYFGIRAYGRIYGVLFSMFTIGNALGAPIVGGVYDRFHSYTPALWLASGLFLVGAGLFAALGFFTPRPGGPARGELELAV